MIVIQKPHEDILNSKYIKLIQPNHRIGLKDKNEKTLLKASI